jgi:predicted HTH transcriptional regulator
MTIRIGRDAYGHHRHVGTQKRVNTSPFVGQKKERLGIERQPRERIAKDLPLSERHEAVLRMVDVEDPIRATEIGEVLGITRSGVNSSLYALQDRGLVQRVPYRGWVKSSPN